MYVYIYIHMYIFHAISPRISPMKCVVLAIRLTHFLYPGTAAFVLESMPDFQERPARCLAAQPGAGFHALGLMLPGWTEMVD